METTCIYHIPTQEPDDIGRLMDCLRGANVFVPGFDASGVDVYDPVVYLHDSAEHGTQTIMIADRNLMSHWVSMAKGTPVAYDGRRAAAVMAFAMCADIQIEPSLAQYEHASLAGNCLANDDLHWFRVADNLDAALWLDLALGRTDALDPQQVVAPSIQRPEGIDFELPLYRWRRNYVLCLKLAELELSDGGSERRMMEFLRWMSDDYLISWPATLLAAYYLAPNSRRRGLLKSIRSEDRNRALQGVRNSTWDLNLLTEWAKRCAEPSDELCILATLDNSLRVLAETMLAPVDTDTAQIIGTRLCDWWGEDAGGRILRQLLQYHSDRGNPARQIHRPYSSTFIDDLMRAGEDRLCGWRPAQSRQKP